MDKIDERYKRGKIYTIRCKYDDDLIYVGSTIQPLSKRMWGHRWDKNCSLYQYVNGDWDNWYIELYEEYPCNNKSCLEKREGEVIRLIGTINKYITGRTKKEWNEDNKDKVVKYKKEWYESNKDKIVEHKKVYYESNKDIIIEKVKLYYENNKDIITEREKNYRENNKEKINEKAKEYYNNNKDKIEEKRKEKVECDKCKSNVCRGDLAKHKKTNKCLNYNVGNN